MRKLDFGLFLAQREFCEETLNNIDKSIEELELSKNKPEFYIQVIDKIMAEAERTPDDEPITFMAEIHWASDDEDEENVTDCFCFCTDEELEKYEEDEDFDDQICYYFTSQQDLLDHISGAKGVEFIIKNIL